MKLFRETPMGIWAKEVAQEVCKIARANGFDTADPDDMVGHIIQAWAIQEALKRSPEPPHEG